MARCAGADIAAETHLGSAPAALEQTDDSGISLRPNGLSNLVDYGGREQARSYTGRFAFFAS